MTISEIALKIIREHLDIEGDIAVDATFGSLGADSLDVVEIVMAIEMELGISTDAFDDWGFDTTIAAVVADVDRASERKAA